MAFQTEVLDLDALAADPVGPADGSLWYNATDDFFRGRANGISETLAFETLTTNGDIVIRAGGVTTRLAIGGAAQVLTVSGGLPSWQASAAGFADPMTTRGDIIYRDATNTTVRLAAGGAGTVLTSDGTDISWAAGGGVTTYLGLTDTPGAFTTPYALSCTNAATNALVETTAQIMEIGVNNFTLGPSCGNATITASECTAFGVGALNAAANAGDDSSAFGYNALGSAVGPFGNNCAFGSGALASCTSGFENTAVGSGAAASLTTAYGTVAIGPGSAASIVDAPRLVAIGLNACATTISGQQVGIGADALRYATGSHNTAIGYQAIQGAAAGSSAASNIGIGSYALSVVTTALNNIAIGYAAMRNTTAAGDCVAIGAWAMQAGGGLGDNHAIGSRVLENCTSYGNLGIGQSSLSTGTSITHNVGIATSTLRDLASGDRNTAIGYEALRHIIGSADAVAVGYQAGRYTVAPANATSLAQCIYIGSGTRSSAVTVANEIAIGYAADGRGANTTIIGNTSTTDTYLAGLVHSDGLILAEQGSTPWTPAVGFGAFWVKDDAPSTPWFTDDDGIDFPLVTGGVAGVGTTKSYTFSQRGLGAGSYWLAGYYAAPVQDVTLTQGSTTQTYGSANTAYGAHAFIVAGGAGTVDAGTVGLRVNGVSITGAGVRTPGDTETITNDITTLALNQFIETAKKWLGTVTYELFGTGGSPTVYSLDFNYGFDKYDDYNNQDITITGLECVGLAGASDSAFDIIFYKHDDQNWTYSAGAFSPGGTIICQMSTDYSTDRDTTNNEYFAYKRSNLSTAFLGSIDEGFVIKVVASQNSTVQSMDAHVVGYAT